MQNSFSRLLFVHLAFLASASTFGAGRAEEPPKVSPTLPVTAFWNHDNIVPVIWIHNKPIACAKARKSNGPKLIIVPNAKPADREWSYAIPLELPICMEQTFERSTVFCENGEIWLQFLEGKKEYRGTYAFTMDDGSKRMGKFRAQHCPATL